MRRSRLGALLSLLLIAIVVCPAAAQTPPIEGIRDNTPNTHALTHVRIVQAPGRVIEDGTIVLRDGVIEAVGEKVTVPKDARVWDYSGLTVYAGLIDLYTHAGIEKPKDDENKGAAYWNEFVTPECDVVTTWAPKEKDLEKLRAAGFTCALVVPEGQVIGGGAAFVNLGDGLSNNQVIATRVAQSVNLVHRFTGYNDPKYPTALMGRIALIRQAFLDAQWYAKAQGVYASNPSQERPENNDALAALADDIDMKRPIIFAVDNDLNLLRSIKIAAEFELPYWIRTGGDDYRQTAAIAAAGAKLIVPVDYPDAPDVESPEQALDPSLVRLQQWESAPSNAMALEKAGIEFALTASGLKDVKSFHKNVHKAIERGLSPETALAALTTVPAKMLGMEKMMGSVDRSKAAHLLVTDGELFADNTKVIGIWIDGHPYDVNKLPETDPRGTWTLSCDALKPVTLDISGETEKLAGKLTVNDSTTVKLTKVVMDHDRVVLVFPGEKVDLPGVVRMSGAIGKEGLSGQGQLPSGNWFKWTATASAGAEEETAKGDDKDAGGVGNAMPHSLGAFGYASIPEAPENVIVKGATIWTCGPDGIIENADLLVKNGRIERVGTDIKVPKNAVVIDGTGKHVTPGLIDCHSHSGVSGSVNEFGQTVSAEVRIADVIDSRAIELYRELAGGLTIANVLHGSANPIGGQNAVIKLRWGAQPDDMIMKEAPQGIKFALGENVKRSNWGDRFPDHYPQTRMGVEQIIRDRLKAALDYERAWNDTKKGEVPPRRDLEMEALLEVLHGDRLVHCHSYRQDEILMLIRVAEDFGFTIGTFQHVLEGYKIAEAIAAHGAGASTFTDWWAYKFEVYDAIPYNGALMNQVGVVVSFNSDSGELARRMNLEAAKAVKYGGLPEAEALKFVTINPATQLHIDQYVGSLEKGKQGDFVVWSASPLSTYGRCEQTWIDGRKYFDIDRDHRMREEIAAERAHIVQEILSTRKGGSEGGSLSRAATSSIDNYEEEKSCAWEH